jgi:monoterpene epsilon-lactone hydrolase
MGVQVWEVDDRRMSTWTRCYVLGMRLARDKQAFEGARHTLRGARERQRRGSAGPTALTQLLVRVAAGDEHGMRVWTVRPRWRRPVATVVYVHGGGYVHPLTADYWRLLRAVARVPARVVVPDYPLAPGATIDDVLPRLVAVHRRAAGAGLPVVLMGDSTGGALVIITMGRHLRRAEDRPVGIVALCPWLDATLDEQAVAALESTDPMLAESGLRAAGRWWAGSRDALDPDVSPAAAADLDGLPPIDVFIGDRDILRPGVDVLAERLRTSSTPSRVHEVSAMFHVWMTRAVPEARRTRRAVRALVREAVSAR